ncbi:unnamed protein product [Vitrella brassicaformis CCMP3155]|uniref:Uncharacterized protein n=1 Tax=Vitrella brassicaformis (strain CCMP3155) TaxID=1169540 RepID=A0A0G4GG70_VITBC|nr:unnamed protein product [Vitrella brassicaformis CCMP3155]|eukprot:CEM28613.1 unnamed protein product [Vitrella brassicaformis CCMP3155]
MSVEAEELKTTDRTKDDELTEGWERAEMDQYLQLPSHKKAKKRNTHAVAKSVSSCKKRVSRKASASAPRRGHAITTSISISGDTHVTNSPSLVIWPVDVAEAGNETTTATPDTIKGDGWTEVTISDLESEGESESESEGTEGMGVCGWLGGWVKAWNDFMAKKVVGEEELLDRVFLAL